MLEKVLWNNNPVCPYCNVSRYTITKEPNRYHCNNCNSTFTVTAKTMFARTRCDLQKWFYAIYLYDNYPLPLTNRLLGELIETTKDTAWLLLEKIRKSNIEFRKKIVDSIGK
ncbi:MAG: transposase [Bacteroidetes bacterium]|nr:transposase [Bacteroidota bacterium]